MGKFGKGKRPRPSAEAWGGRKKICKCVLMASNPDPSSWNILDFKIKQKCKKCKGKFKDITPDVQGKTRKARNRIRQVFRDIGDRGVISLGEQEQYMASLLQEVKQNDNVEEGHHANKVKLDDINTSNTISETAIKYSRIASNKSLDDELYFQLRSKENYQQYHHSKGYQKLMDFRKKLPSYAMKDNIVNMVGNNQVSLISGETGCGKTTQVAQFILDDYIKRRCGSTCHIVCTQPRRISAVSVAERIASERDEPLGNSCGFKIRMENKLPRRQGSILFCTLGVLLRIMISDPYLQKVSHVIIDEIHERDILSDFLLIIIKTILPNRPDLKIILMSATLNAEIFSKFFNDCPMINIPGRTYEVQKLYLEDILEKIDYHHPRYDNSKNANNPMKKARNERQDQDMKYQYSVYLDSIKTKYSPKTITNLRNMDFIKLEGIFYELIIAVVNYICQSSKEGAILIFLPGWPNIKKLCSKFNNHQTYSNKSNFIVMALHSKLPTASQREVFDRPPVGCRKIIIATNIAESSITIDDIIFVIDCGKSKEKAFDADSNISSLDTTWISKASAKQRSGRAGRVQPGHSFHLYTKFHENNFREFQEPEILRSPLAALCLKIKILKCGNISQFLSKAIEPPTPAACQQAIDELVQMTALDEDEKLTSLGYHLALLPVAPKIGRMILCGAIFSCLDPVLTVAASLDSKDPFYIPIDKEVESYKKRLTFAEGSKSDHIVLINAFRGWECTQGANAKFTFCQENFLSMNNVEFISGMKDQFTYLLKEIGFVHTNNPKDPDSNRNSANINLIKAVVCAGVYPNVAKVEYNYKGHRLIIRSVGKAKPGETLPAVDIHPKSVNKWLKEYQSQWIIYHEKLKTTKTFIYDTTVISPYPLLFFGGVIKYHQECGVDTIEVDDGIKFHASNTTAEIIMGLRKELDKLLLKKINNPSMELVAGRMSKSDEKIMTAIIHLISHEKVQDKKSTDLLNQIKAANSMDVMAVDDDFTVDGDFDDNNYDNAPGDESDENPVLITGSKHLEESEFVCLSVDEEPESKDLNEPEILTLDYNDDNSFVDLNNCDEFDDEKHKPEIIYSNTGGEYDNLNEPEILTANDNDHSFVDEYNCDGFDVENY